MIGRRKYSFILVTCLVLSLTALAKKTEDKLQLRQDLQMVWPLIQIVKIEYELVNAQLTFYKTKKEKTSYLERYEKFVKRKYFYTVKELNLRQGKLLLLLIDRELDKTPFDLLWEYRSFGRALFWQRCSRLVGANLRTKYNAELFPEIEAQMKEINKLDPLMYPSKNLVCYER